MKDELKQKDPGRKMETQGRYYNQKRKKRKKKDREEER
jgi:hypothetical protein